MDTDTCFLFAPSSSYPRPYACLIDRRGHLVHAWSNPCEQPDPATDPPTYLRGWNHVELADDGSLYVTVPLHALVKLHPNSTIAWTAPLPVHHDLDIGPDGEVYTLTEQPRLVPWPGGGHVLLDNQVTILSPDGAVVQSHSLYDVLTTDLATRMLIDQEISRRRAAHSGTLAGADALDGRRGRDVSRLLRDVPGSPSDVLHANTIEILPAHPHGLWDQGDVLISLRNLNLIAAVNLPAQAVRWWWGPGHLSGQHQPSALPGGTVLVFDNGQTIGRSRVLEVDPTTGAIVWQYTADPPQTLFSAMAGGCEQLPGGTVLISDAQAGRALEITRAGQTVWAVQIHTPHRPTTSRCEIYRLSAVPGHTAAALDGGNGAARQLAAAQVHCDIDPTVPSPRSQP